MKKIKGIKFGDLEVVLEGERDDDKDYDFGALTLSCEGREFILDTIQSYTDGTDITGDGTTRITLELIVDEETFDECPYNLTNDDMFDDDMVAEFYIGGNFDNKLVSMTFYFEADGEDYQIKVVQD